VVQHVSIILKTVFQVVIKFSWVPHVIHRPNSHYLRKDSRLFLRADLQRLVVGMADSSGDERVVYAPPPSYKFIKQDNKGSPLV
jgi:hypothetical protein